MCRGRGSNPHAPLRGQLILSQPRIANFATPATGKPNSPAGQLKLDGILLGGVPYTIAISSCC